MRLQLLGSCAPPSFFYFYFSRTGRTAGEICTSHKVEKQDFVVGLYFFKVEVVRMGRFCMGGFGTGGFCVNEKQSFLYRLACRNVIWCGVSC